MVMTIRSEEQDQQIYGRIEKKPLWKRIKFPSIPSGIGIVIAVILIGLCVKGGFKLVSENVNDANRYDSLMADYKTLDAEMSNKLKQVTLDRYKEGITEGRRLLMIEIKEAETQKFQPVTVLSKSQETLALSILMYGESAGEPERHREAVAWTAINRAMDPRDDKIYRNSITAVVASASQYTSMSEWQNTLRGIAWGDIISFIPHSAKDLDTDNGKAWLEIVTLAKDIMEGNRERTTIATHFFAPQEMKGKLPSWAEYFKPLGSFGRHIMFTDHVYIDGKMVQFTKELRYDPNIHDTGTNKFTGAI